VSQNASLSVGIASRYAQAVFDLAREDGDLVALSRDVQCMREVHEGSSDLQTLIQSPIYTRDQVSRAIQALASHLGLSTIFANTLALMASKRRLFVLIQFLDRLDVMIDEEKGVTSAEVISADPLDEDDLQRLEEVLKRKTGKDVRLAVTVDPDLISGLVVRLGSRLVDNSLRTKLSTMRQSLREV